MELNINYFLKDFDNIHSLLVYLKNKNENDKFKKFEKIDNDFYNELYKNLVEENNGDFPIVWKDTDTNIYINNFLNSLNQNEFDIFYRNNKLTIKQNSFIKHYALSYKSPESNLEPNKRIKVSKTVQDLISKKGLNISNGKYGTSLSVPLYSDYSNKKTKILLINERHKLFWSFAGGKLDNGNESREEGLKREMSEESGNELVKQYDKNNNKLIYFNYRKNDINKNNKTINNIEIPELNNGPDWINFVFVFPVDSDKIKYDPTQKPSETKEHKFFSIDKLIPDKIPDLSKSYNVKIDGKDYEINSLVYLTLINLLYS